MAKQSSKPQSFLAHEEKIRKALGGLHRALDVRWMIRNTWISVGGQAVGEIGPLGFRLLPHGEWKSLRTPTQRCASWPFIVGPLAGDDFVRQVGLRPAASAGPIAKLARWRLLTPVELSPHRAIVGA